MLRTLFTSNSKKIVKIVKIIIWLVLFFVPATAVIRNLNYVQDSTDDWPRIMWHNFYEQKSIDNVCVGSSHVFFDINPDILNEIDGEKYFNVASTSQHMNGTYYSLLEADRKYDIKKAYIEAYYVVNTGTNGDYCSDVAVKSGWYTTDDMSRFSPVRVRAIWDMNPVEKLPDAVFPFVRFRGYLFDYAHIRSMLIKKGKSDYKEYKYHFENDEPKEVTDYTNKGYCATDRIYDNSVVFGTLRKPEEMHISEDASEYLEKCIAYCKRNNIELTLFISPVWDTSIISTENYDMYSESVKAIADANNVAFYDFNLCRNEFLDIHHTDCFYDVDHLNITGASQFTRFFYDVVNGEMEQNKVMFYNSYMEKLEAEKPELYGMSVWLEDDGKILSLAATGLDDLEFKIMLKSAEEENDEYELIQNFSDNSKVKTLKDDHGTCQVTWRTKSNPGEEYIKEFVY